MKTVVIGPRPAELDEILTRRHALGHDGYDEVWKGDYHMAPMAHPWHGYVQNQITSELARYVKSAGLFSMGPFNLGEPDDFRVPDGGVHRHIPATPFVATVAMVIEVVSPGDESWEKFGFYAARGVEEILIADPTERTIAMFVRAGAEFERTDRSELLGVTAEVLRAAIAWPGTP